jgi:hypothetical protein
MSNEKKIPKHFVLSLLLGVPFLSAWLGFTAMAAKDGRQPVTDWLDPLLAGLTLLTILVVQTIFLMVWSQIKDSFFKNGLTWALMISQWFYIFGEILSNTITIGEPPQDIGSLFEISSGVIVFLSSLCLIATFINGQITSMQRQSRKALIVLSMLLFVGMSWWFTHPIDQSKPGSPNHISGNHIYNFFHSFK